MTRVGALAGLLPISVVEEDGLLVTTCGRYVRLLECGQVPNTVTADQTMLGRIESAFAHVCRLIGDRQSLVIYAQTDPVPTNDALKPDKDTVEVAARQDLDAGHADMAQVRSRLFEATKQTVRAAAGAEQPAVLARWWVAVPYLPTPTDVRSHTRRLIAGARGRTVWEAHLDAALESQRLTNQVEGALRRAGIDSWLMAGAEVLAVLWERLHPAAPKLPDFEHLASACVPLATATTPAQAARVRHQLLEAVCGDPPARIDLSESPVWVRHQDGTLEEVIHLGTPPQATDPSWLAYLLTAPLPATLAVHISVGSRSGERAKQRRRWQRLRAAVRYKDRREQLIGSDEEDAVEEAAILDQELSAQIGATVYDVGVYCSYRDPSGDREQFERTIKQACSDFHQLTNARVVRGRYLARQGFTSTLPLGIDRLRARRRYAQRNIAHCVALTSSRCGCPQGLVLGTADPGGTLERLDPYDPQFNTSLTLITGRGGGGKTVTSILLAARFLSQGGRLFVTDRSSTPDETGDSTGTGHYDTLLSLVPGGRRVQLGTAHGAVICPWDTPDARRVPDQKLEFLLALHALLIGETQDPEGLLRTIGADEEALLRDGITTVYRHCAHTGQRPREQLLIDTLRARHTSGELEGSNRDRLQSLLLRLAPYGQDGTLAHIADRQSTVPEEAPMVLFDFTGLSDRLAPALTLAVADWVEGSIHRQRRRRIAGDLDAHGRWAGKSQLIIEEGWKPLSSPAAGAWLNEYARRARHYALWLTFITQFFRDFDSEQGRALLSNHAVALCLPNERSDLEFARDTVGLSDTDIEEITGLPSEKGSYSTLYMVSKRGRGAVRIAPAAPEYWIASSNPEHDQPRRHQALKHAGGDPWTALTLLCDPDWQERYARHISQATAP